MYSSLKKIIEYTNENPRDFTMGKYNNKIVSNFDVFKITCRIQD